MVLNTKDEIMYKFAADLNLIAEDEEKRESGESQWQVTPQTPQAPLIPGADQWKPKEEPDVHKEVPVPYNIMESEWYNPESEYYGEEEMERRFESDMPSPDEYEPERGYRYNPKEEVIPEHSDAQVLEMIKDEPIHALTNLMIQRKPEYQKLGILLPLARGVLDWLTEADISPEKGTILYEETNYILDLLDKIANERDKTKEE